MHPLGVVLETVVDCGQSAGVLEPIFLLLFITRTGQAVPSGDYSSGGTLSAPTGCSSRDHHRLRAVGGGMRELKLFLAGTDRTCSSLTRRSSNTGDRFASSKMFLSESSSSGGTLSAPTGCSPRDCRRLRAVGGSLRACLFVVVWPSLGLGGPFRVDTIPVGAR